jgi:hypothetical protein
MAVPNIRDYTFQGLRSPVGSHKDPGDGCPALCYLIGLTDSPTHKISDPLIAKRILSWLYDTEEQASDPAHLRVSEGFFERYFQGGYNPSTPCMVVTRWSPISSVLERGFEPLVLNRESKFLAVASGIWGPFADLDFLEIGSAKTDEELFWAIIGVASGLAVEQKRWISIIAGPGWSYEAAIGSLPNWKSEESSKAGRVLWKRTPQG